jgi:hypothetical protein
MPENQHKAFKPGKGTNCPPTLVRYSPIGQVLIALNNMVSFII